SLCLPLRTPRKTIWLSSGDQTGALSSPGSKVKRDSGPCWASTTYSSELPLPDSSEIREKATRRSLEDRLRPRTDEAVISPSVERTFPVRSIQVSRAVSSPLPLEYAAPPPVSDAEKLA